MSKKLYEEVDKISKKCIEEGKYQDAESLLMKIVDSKEIVSLNEKQSAIISILTLNPYYTPTNDVFSYNIIEN